MKQFGRRGKSRLGKSTTKGKIIEQIESLSDEEVPQVLDLIKLLQEQPEELTEPEFEEITVKYYNRVGSAIPMSL